MYWLIQLPVPHLLDFRSQVKAGSNGKMLYFVTVNSYFFPLNKLRVFSCFKIAGIFFHQVINFQL